MTLKHFKSAKELMQKCIDTWGDESQMLCCVSECGELIQALAKYILSLKFSMDHQGAEKDLIDNIADEIADVEITTSQVKIILKDKNILYKINERKKFKLERTEQRLLKYLDRDFYGEIIEKKLDRLSESELNNTLQTHSPHEYDVGIPKSARNPNDMPNESPFKLRKVEPTAETARLKRK